LSLSFLIAIMSREYIPAALRRLVFQRSKGYCEYCRSPGRFALGSMEIEHTMPLSRGGKTVGENLALACRGCNQNKGSQIEGIDPGSLVLVPLYNPREMEWDEHFAWGQGAMLVVGKTPTGRATVEVLRLNREGVVNLRRLMINSGEHPPD
jgi:hypothetical protein